MKVIILAAGRSMRLAELTKDIPKCLLNIGEQTILERQIDILNACGFNNEDIWIVIGYKAEQIYVDGVNLVYNHEYHNTDNAHSLYLAINEIGNPDDILVLDSDLIFSQQIIEQVIYSSHKNVLLTQNSSLDAGDTGIVVNNDGKAIEIGKHIINSNNVFTGILKMSSRACTIMKEELAAGEYKQNWYTVPLNNRLSEVAFYISEAIDIVHEINTIDDYTNAQMLFGRKRKRVLLTGASGLLGEKLFTILSRNYEVIGIRKTTKGAYISLNLIDYDAVSAFIELSKPDIIVHAAGIADPDICEQDKKAAYEANVVTIQNICRSCQGKEIKIVHISTDYVFSGEKDTDYFSTDERSSTNYYGLTKIQAEDIVTKHPGSLLFRIPVLYGYNNDDDKSTFLTQTINKLRNGEQIMLDSYAYRYPVLTDEVAIAIDKLLNQQGIIQISSSLSVTKADWGEIIANEFNMSVKNITPIGAAPAIAERPRHIKMDTSLADSLNIKMSDVPEGTHIVNKQMNCVFKMIYKSLAHEQLFGYNVSLYRYELGKMLVNLVPAEVLKNTDCIIPVPESGLYYAIGFAEALQKPYQQALVKIENTSRSFEIMDLPYREGVIQKKIIPIRELIESKNVILLDEAIFSGTTLKIVCDMLKACNVGSVHIFIPTPICSNRCQYYIQPDRQLLSEYTAPEEFSKYFGADSVSFQEYDTFVESIKRVNKSICVECFTKSN